MEIKKTTIFEKKYRNPHKHVSSVRWFAAMTSGVIGRLPLVHFRVSNGQDCLPVEFCFRRVRAPEAGFSPPIKQPYRLWRAEMSYF
jgi:hypothetical protein